LSSKKKKRGGNREEEIFEQIMVENFPEINVRC
jgi:hypothetical protein